MKIKGKRGFTIIELLIVMAVIAILVGIAVPSFRGIQVQAWKSKASGDTKVLKISLESYYMKNGTFPTDTPETAYQAALLSESPSMIEANMYDPFGAAATSVYKYDISDNGKYYIVYSVGSAGNGAASINNSGLITVSAGEPIYASNGRLP
jgi:prepilin-type N-terminal cleavage/methylation domain-containing protein